MVSPPRRFSDLRRVESKPTVVPDHGDEPIEAVMRRLFLTGSDGPRVLAWMEAQVGAPQLAEEPTDRALSMAEGARRFVHSLKSTVVHVAPRSTPA